MPQGSETQPLEGATSYTALVQSSNLPKELALRTVKKPYHVSRNGVGALEDRDSGMETTTPSGGSLDRKVAAMETLQKDQEPVVQLPLDGFEHSRLSVPEGPPQSKSLALENISNTEGPSACIVTIIEDTPPPTPTLDGPIQGPGCDKSLETEAEQPTHALSPDLPAARPRNTNGAIFSNEFIEVRPSSVSGFGVFALKDLRYGDVILTEYPLLRTTPRLVFRDFENLDDEGKRAYMSLTGFSMKKTAHIVEKILLTNSFQVPGGVAVFSVASRFNHACKPIRNVLFRFDQMCGMMKFTVVKNRVSAGKELLINYGGTPIEFYRVWGFRCSCGACSPVSDRELGIICKETWCT